ncbi:UNVERIFIED_CONTAM: hypothetical protein HDU68_006923 [Siphonaria sp. JEL0065]|nr:hypothetical protein HDU68_006923 [Siphonaria sp. JEL0065]
MEGILQALSVPLLEKHWKAAVLSALFWQFVFVVGRWASDKLLPQYQTWDKLWGYNEYAGNANAMILGKSKQRHK